MTCNILILSRRRGRLYLAHELPCDLDGCRAFRVTGGRYEYDVLVHPNPRLRRCECGAYEMSGHCKHTAALAGAMGWKEGP